MDRRIFRYNGLGGTEAGQREYVGLLAQEVPPSLAQYCRLRAHVLLRPSDEATTEVFMLDHSCFPFLAINGACGKSRIEETPSHLPPIAQDRPDVCPCFALPNMAAVQEQERRLVHLERLAQEHGSLMPRDRCCALFIAWFTAVGEQDDADQADAAAGGGGCDAEAPLLDVAAARPGLDFGSLQFKAMSMLALGISILQGVLIARNGPAWTHDRSPDLAVPINTTYAPFAYFIIYAFTFGDEQGFRPGRFTWCAFAFASIVIFVLLGAHVGARLLVKPVDALSARDIVITTQLCWHALSSITLVALVFLERLGPWAALLLKLCSTVFVSWLCAAAHWLATANVYTPMNYPASACFAITFTWLLASRAMAADVRPAIVSALRRVVPFSTRRELFLERLAPVCILVPHLTVPAAVLIHL